MKKLGVPLALCGLACLAPGAMAESAGAAPTAPLCRLSDGPIANQEAKAGYWMMVDPGGDVIRDPGPGKAGSFWALAGSDDVIPDTGGKGPYWDLLSSDDVLPGDPGKQGNFWGLPGSDDVIPDGGGKGTYWELQSADDPR